MREKENANWALKQSAENNDVGVIQSGPVITGRLVCKTCHSGGVKFTYKNIVF